jgi:hypothetical protein
MYKLYIFTAIMTGSAIYGTCSRTRTIPWQLRWVYTVQTVHICCYYDRQRLLWTLFENLQHSMAAKVGIL